MATLLERLGKWLTTDEGKTALATAAGAAFGGPGGAVTGFLGSKAGDIGSGIKGGLQDLGLMGPDRIKFEDRKIAPEAAGFQSEFERAAYNRYLAEAEARNRAAAAQQQSLVQALQARIEGKAPSLAEMQLQRTLAASKLAEQQKLAQSGRGLSPGLASYLLAQNRARLESGTAGQAALLRAQEQQAAEGALGTLLGQMRQAEGTQFGQAATAGLGQERLGVETQEAQRKREFDVAQENLRAQQEADRLRQAQEAESYASAARARGQLGGAIEGGAKMAGEIAKATAGVPGAAQGGMVKRYAEGGKVSKAKQIAAHAAAKKHMKGFKEQYGKEEGERIAYATMMNMAKKNKLAEGGECMADGGEINAAMGHLSKMDSEENDTVPAMLSPGEIVIPRSIVASPKPGVAAKKFVEALLNNKDKRDAKEMALRAALGKKAVENV